jgi:hypothetical protein
LFICDRRRVPTFAAPQPQVTGFAAQLGTLNGNVPRVFRMAGGKSIGTQFLTLLLPPILFPATSSTGMFRVEREVQFFTTPGTWMMLTTGTALLFVLRRWKMLTTGTALLFVLRRAEVIAATG